MPYPVIDIFAGPGGLGEGFASLFSSENKPSFKTVLSIEKDPSAHQTLRLRSFFRQFYPGCVPEEYWHYAKGNISLVDLFELYPKQAAAAEKEAVCLELGDTTHAKVKSLISDRLDGSARWVLVGGPPCQAYSLAGRSRMRNTNPDFENDERHLLYLEYLRIIADHAPPVFVMENVKGILSSTHSGENIIEKIILDLKDPSQALGRKNRNLKYDLYSLSENKQPEKCTPEDFIVKCEKFGIPQTRHRLLILGIRADAKVTPDILSPQYAPSVQQIIGDLPRLRSTVSREKDSLECWKEIIQSVQSQKWYTTGKNNGLLQTTEVIDNAIDQQRDLILSSGAEFMDYEEKPDFYADWYRKDCPNVILNHTARGHMRSDLYRYLFASSYTVVNKKSPNLSHFPKTLLPKHRNIEGKITEVSFADRFRVQAMDRPAATITSHISKDGHYFIHYDPIQCRSLTVREAARLQTFPDNYKFEGNRTSQYHQVGNAVPPLLAQQIAKIVYNVLGRIKL